MIVLKFLKKCWELIKKYVPGLLLLLAIALAATFLSKYLPSYIGKVFIAVIIGILIANIFRPKKEIFGKGIKLGLSKLLKLAIILMGAGNKFRADRSTWRKRNTHNNRADMHSVWACFPYRQVPERTA